MSGGYLSQKMKRKDLDEIGDDFSDYSLSSPAPKIRRLDAELPLIIEEEEGRVHPAVLEEQSPSPLRSSENLDMAIVPFKPINAYLPQPSSNFYVNLDSNVISGFKNQFLLLSQSDHRKLSEEEAATENEITENCKAVVPWVSSRLPMAQGVQTRAPEMVEAEDMGEAAMDIEDNNSESSGQGHAYDFGGMRGSDGFPQWQQQHCMLPPQLPQNTFTPVTWLQ